MPSRMPWLWLCLFLWGGHIAHAGRHLICQGRANARSQEPQCCNDQRCLAHPACPLRGCHGSVCLSLLLPSAVPGGYT